MGGRPLDARNHTSPPGALSGLLTAWGRGDLEARDALLPIVYAELRRRAAGYLRRERRDHTLQPTALVNEAYLRLAGQAQVSWKDRAHFFCVASQVMRRILVDHARARRAQKRPRQQLKVSLEELLVAAAPPPVDLLALDEALSELTTVDARLAQVTELRYFGGLSEQEVARVLSLSRATVTRDWQTARAWLYRRMTAGRHAALARP
ncbi:MAG TPA: sigma-70 family RNA polymerase sigma factor [Vicinamibacterales bacterium]|nr:sigma-70 family RNA polymerase sigma factor [Vicinamibacterales bacterium]